jgi:hypothetical protein
MPVLARDFSRYASLSDRGGELFACDEADGEPALDTY